MKKKAHKILFWRIRVIGVTYHKYEPGYIEPSEQRENQLVSELVLVNCVIWRNLLDYEKVPNCVAISQGCFGDTEGFVSKFAPFDKNGNLLQN